MKLKLDSITSAYNSIKKRALKEYAKGDFEKSLFYIDKAAVLSSQIISRYSDDEFEELLLNISQKTITPFKEKYIPNQNRVVFYDGFGVSYILAIQYMKALVAMGKEVLYIYEEREHQHNKLVPVIDIFREYPKVSIEIIAATKNKTDKLQQIYDVIIGFCPEKLFTHIDAHSAVIPVLYSLPPAITRYHINLGDHLFWLGTKGIDYTYEFRSFGAVVSHEKRGLRQDQTLFLPYYPITESKTFLGFPEESKNKVVIFSGGDLYKTIDNDNTYWELVKALLNENPTAVVLFACKLTNDKGPQILQQFIDDNGFENRFFSIGFRTDINEVLQHCDIFLGTCPMSGGLMSQYAAVNAKPILQYYPPELSSNNETESVICVHDTVEISYTDKQEFLKEAKRLISSETYRKEKGAKIKSCMITESEFNVLFAKSLDDHITPVPIEHVKIQYDALTAWWIEIGSKGYFDVIAYIYSVLGNKGLLEVPEVIGGYLYKRYVTDKLLSLKWYRGKVVGSR